MIKYNKVIRPWLGIVGKNIISADELGDNHDPTGGYGVLVENLIVDGPSYKAGVRIGDLLMAINSKKIYDLNELQRTLSGKAPSEQIRLKLYRRGKGFLHLQVALSEIPKAQDLPQEKDLF